MTRNHWSGLYILTHIVALAVLLSACSQESTPVVQDVVEIQAVPTLTPLPPPAVEEEVPTALPEPTVIEIIATTVLQPTATEIIVTTEVAQVIEPTEESIAEDTAVPSTNLPPTTIPSTATPVPPTLVPTDPPPPTQAPTVVNVTTGQTDDGTFFIGDVSAPVRLVDYSDFV